MTWFLRAVSGLGPEARRPQSGALRSAFPAGSRGIPGPCWLVPFAVEPSASRQLRRQWPTADDSPAGRRSCGGVRLLRAVRRLAGGGVHVDATARCMVPYRRPRPGSGTPGSPDPVTSVGPTRRTFEVNVAVHQLAQPKRWTRGDRQKQCGIGLQAVIVEGGVDATYRQVFSSSFAHLLSPLPRLQPHHRDGLDPNEVRTIILGAQRQVRR